MLKEETSVISLSLSNGVVQPAPVGSESGAKIKPHWGWNSSLPSGARPF